jgi:hypothetical protein
MFCTLNFSFTFRTGFGCFCSLCNVFSPGKEEVLNVSNKN